MDTGGTFTDIVRMKDGNIIIEKQLSTPHDPSGGILSWFKKKGCTDGSPTDRSPDEHEEFIYGSTVATNAVLERRGADVALITTKGFEEVIFIGRQNRPNLYDLYPERTRPLVDRKNVFSANERTLHGGTVLRDLTDIDVLIEAVSRSNANAIAISLLHSYANPRNERILKKTLSTALPDIPITLSSSILPEYREFERTSTTVINAFVLPLMRDHILRLKENMGTGRFRIMQSNGGCISAEKAMEEPARTVLSGPAGGVVGALAVASRMGYDNIITFDMGGTSTDVSLCSGRYTVTKEYGISGLPLSIPMLDINTVGSGGGSIVHMDIGGGIRVGPRSAGAFPGPVCFGRGGTKVTVTDANLVLGRLYGKRFLGGKMSLDHKKAEDAVDSLARSVDMDALFLAEGIIKIANSSMQRAIMSITVRRGHDPRDFTLVTYGGAGGLHACELAEELGIKKILVPPNPGVLSAFGMLLSDVIRDYSRSFPWTDKEIILSEMEEAYTALESDALSDLGEEGFGNDRLKLRRSVDMRYKRQSHELTVRYSKNLISDFHLMHKRRYGHCDEGEEVETVNLRLEGIGLTDKYLLESLPLREKGDRVIDRTALFFRGKEHDAVVIDREKLSPDDVIRGAALVTEYTATTFISPGYRAAVNRYGGIEIWRE